MKKSLDKYKGVIAAFYACYDDEGNISVERTKKFAQYLIEKGIQGLYVCGSSGECIYQSKEERKLTLESVMDIAKGKITIIAHVACNNTADSKELAAHAQSLGVDAIASIPPIYFKLPEHAIASYWNDISAAAPETDFIIYNIPQLAGVALTIPLFKKMLENKRVIGVKNSSMPVQDIQMFKDAGGENIVVFNGPDEQFISGRLMGADGGIGGTYAVMPELFLKANALFMESKFSEAREIQYDICRIIYAMCECNGNLYAVMKELLKRRGMNIGGVRAPLTNIIADDNKQIDICEKMIQEALNKY